MLIAFVPAVVIVVLISLVAVVLTEPGLISVGGKVEA